MPIQKDCYGRTPLSWAAREGRDIVIKLLIKTGKVDIDSKDDDGRTPLYWAAFYGHEAVVKLLKKQYSTLSPPICYEPS
jgi:ankyrin repeat protein